MKARMMFTACTLAMLSATAFADDGSLSLTAAAPKMRVQAQVEMLPLGSGETTMGSTSNSRDAAIAYGISGAFDYAIGRYLRIGVAPRLVLNVTPDDAADGTKADKELDLRARIIGHYPVQPGLDLYAALTPGYTFVLSGTDGIDNATGFAIGGAVGLTYDVSPKMFVGGEVGYQRAFTSTELMIGTQSSTADLDLSYMHVGIGAGARF
jgi:hypothetical protein